MVKRMNVFCIFPGVLGILKGILALFKGINLLVSV